MPVPPECWRIVYQGRLRNGEQWQTGYWLQGNAPSSNASCAAGADLEMGAESGSSPSSLWNVLKASLPSGITLDNVKVFSYPSGGTAAQFSGISSHAPILGAATGSDLPNQIAMCMSLLTGAAGRSARGRMYLPIGSAAIDSATGLFSTISMGTIVTALARKFTDGNAASGWGKAVVVSQKNTTALQILQVRVDTRPDVQRRRANRESGIVSTSVAVVP